MLYLRQRAEIGLDCLKVAISTLKMKNVQDGQKKLKMKTWRHYAMAIAVKPLEIVWCMKHYWNGYYQTFT